MRQNFDYERRQRDQAKAAKKAMKAADRSARALVEATGKGDEPTPDLRDSEALAQKGVASTKP